MTALVDTSVWVDHFRGAPGATALGDLLDDGEVRIHPWIVGELALGHLGARRSQILADLDRLPVVPAAADAEVRTLIETRRLRGTGLGWVDAHVLASALLGGVRIWSLDRALASTADRLGVAFDP